jgi:alpha-1,6-mannosyltransferase
MLFFRMQKSKQLIIRVSTFIVYLIGLVVLGYFTPRVDFFQLIILYLVLFGLYIFIISSGIFKSNVIAILGGALLLRLALLLMTPNLTDDYFRYIWDGLIVASGHNPFLSLPSEVIANSQQAIPGLTSSLYGHLNSAHFYSAYPPAAQLIFGLSAKLAGGSIIGNIIFLRSTILLAEFGTLAMMYKLSFILKFPQTYLFIYAFNPLVIMELTGNLHLEAFMIFFLLLAIFLIVKKKHAFSAICFSISIGIKLMPLIFLPFLIKRLGLKMSLFYLVLIAGTIFLLALPFLNLQSVSNYFSSLALFFRVLQFNSIVYSIVRWIGFQNISAIILNLFNVILPALGFLGILLLSIKERVRGWQSLFSAMLFGMTIYFFTSANVHAWYLTSMVALSVFTRFRYAIAWSFLAIFAYVTYQTVPYAENLYVVTLEYFVVVAWMAYELWVKREQAYCLSDNQ